MIIKKYISLSNLKETVVPEGADVHSTKSNIYLWIMQNLKKGAADKVDYL